MSLPVTGSDYCTTQIVASTDQTTTSLLVASPTEPFPLFDATHTYFYLTIVDEPSYIIDADPPTQREIVKVYAYAVVATGYELTCVRGSAGTNAQIWAVGAVAEIRPCAQWFEDVKGGGGGGDVTSVTSTDVAITINPTIGDVLVNGNDFVASGVSHAHGLVPDPGAVAGTTKFLREDATWDVPPGAATVQAQYVTLALDSGLTSERVLTAGSGISITDGGANSTVTIAATGSGGAPTDATFVTLSLNGTLTQERVLTAGTGISLTDGGANSTITVTATGLYALTLNHQTGTTYTIQASDNGAVIWFDNGSPITVTIPAGLGAAFWCEVMQVGDGLVQFTTSGGTTLHAYGNMTNLAGPDAACRLIAYEANVFNLTGNIRSP